MSITVPPMSAIIPLTIKMISTNIPKKASPISERLFRSLVDIQRARAHRLMFLVEMLVGIDSANEASE
jgi:hypothetical protein